VTYLGRGLNKPRHIFSRINGTVSDLLQVTYFGNNYLSPSFWLEIGQFGMNSCKNIVRRSFYENIVTLSLVKWSHLLGFTGIYKESFWLSRSNTYTFKSLATDWTVWNEL
jgi:hypothetical protein